MSGERLERIEAKLDLILSLLNKDTSVESSQSCKPLKSRKKKSEIKKIIIKQGKCSLDVYKDALLITGNTYDRKELIKSYGARWNSDNKGWTININKLKDVKLELEKHFETVTFNEEKKNINLLLPQEEESFEDSGECDIESDTE